MPKRKISFFIPFYFFCLFPPAFCAESKKEIILTPFMASRFGFVDSTGATVIQPQFDYAEDFSNGFAAVLKDGKFGFIDEKGNYRVEPKYDRVGNFFDDLAAVQKDGKWGYINVEGLEVISPQFDQVYEFSEGLAPAKQGGKWGYIDTHGKWAIVPKFTDISEFSEGLANVDVTHFIDKTGKEVFELKGPTSEEDWHFAYTPPMRFKNGIVCYGESCSGAPPNCNYYYADRTGVNVEGPTGIGEDPTLLSEGLGGRKAKGLWGYVDAKDRWVIPARYSSVQPFSEGLAGVVIARKDPDSGKAMNVFVYIDLHGKIVLDNGYTLGYPFHDGCAEVCLPYGDEGGSTCQNFIDRQGKVLFKGNYERIVPFQNGLALACDRDSYSFIDKTGAVSLGPYSKAKSFENGLAWVEGPDGAGYIDHTGKWIVGPGKLVGPMSQNRIRYMEKGTWGYRDSQGQVALEPKYEEVRSFSEGMAVVKEGGITKVIDGRGKVLSELPGIPFDRLHGFQEKLQPCWVPVTFADETQEEKDREAARAWGFIDLTGKFVIKPQYDKCLSFYEGLAAVQKNGLWGFVDAQGREVIKPKYPTASAFNEGLALEQMSNPKSPNQTFYGYIDKLGNTTIPPVYTIAMDFKEGLAFVGIPDAKGTKTGFIDRQNHWVGSKYKDLDCGYCQFQEGVSPACSKGVSNVQYGYINPQGKWVIPPAYDIARPFQEGMAAVSNNKKWGFVNPAGELVVPILYDEVGDFKEGLARAVLGPQYYVHKDSMGFIDPKGQWVIHSDQYLKVSDFEGGVAEVWGKDGYYEWLNPVGKVLRQMFDFGLYSQGLMDYPELDPNSKVVSDPPVNTQWAP